MKINKIVIIVTMATIVAFEQAVSKQTPV